ncbi:ATP synthase F1 subunit epsilon [Candidatus Nomurabacteria bacterium]|nr:ATP synthase F1 subunit epsilon [Candidatus Nomurabacteria bacterium]
MKLQLVTLEGVQLDKEVYEVQLSTESGPIGIYPGHEALVSIAKPGIITVRYSKSDDDGHLDYFAIGGGVIDIDNDVVQVLVDAADRGEDIVESEAKAALEKALELKRNAKDSVELEKASALVDRHQVRLDVAGLRRRKRR